MNDIEKKRVDVCSEYALSCLSHEDSLTDSLLDVSGLSELFRAMGDETRVSILYLLSKRELCVCDLAYLLDISLPAVSHHLRLLKVMHLVRSTRTGKQVFYTLDDPHVLSLIEVAREHYAEWR